jgi:3-oxoacyl-[acyl-carrier-protein] synthase II
MTMFPDQTFPVMIGAEAKSFTGDAENYGPLDKELKKTIRKAQKVMCREIQMGVAAAQRALFHSKLIPEPKFASDRVGCVFGSDYMLTDPDEFSAGVAVCKTDDTLFEYKKWASDAFEKLYPLWLLKYLPNMPAAHVSIFNDLRGPNNSLTQREASANLAVGEAFRTIARGHADAMVAGSTGTRLQIMKSIHAVQTEELARAADPTKASRPFDRDRTGMVMGEGAGSVVLEELSHAQARGRDNLRRSAWPCLVDRRQSQGRRSRPGVGAGNAELSPRCESGPRKDRPPQRSRPQHAQLRPRRSRGNRESFW